MRHLTLLLTGVLLLAAVVALLFAALSGGRESNTIEVRDELAAGPGDAVRRSVAPAEREEEEEEPPANPDRAVAREAIGSAGYLPRIPVGAVEPCHLSFTGHLVDEHGEPLEGVNVQVSLVRGFDRLTSAGTTTWKLHEVETGPGGGFSFTELPFYGHAVLIGAETPERPRAEWVLGHPLGGETLDLGAIVLGKGGMVQGTVLDAAGEPVPNARVLWRREPESNGRLVGLANQNDSGAKSDTRGRFVARDVAPGSISFAAHDESKASRWTEPVEVLAGQALDLIQLEQLEALGYAPLEGVTIVMGGDLVLTGLLIDEISGTGLEGRVVVHAADLGPYRVPALEGGSDVDGRFQLRGLWPGLRYSVSGTAPGYRGEGSLPVLARPPGEGPPITVALRRARAPVVHVRDAVTLAPIEGARLSWVDWSISPVPTAALLDPSHPAAITDAEGNATLAAITGGLWVQAAGYEAENRSSRSDEGLLYELHPARRLHVVVMDDKGPVPNAVVELRAYPMPFPYAVPRFAPDNSHALLLERFVTDRFGRVTFGSLPRRGRVRVDAGARGGWISGVVVLDDESQREFHLEARVQPAAELHGDVFVQLDEAIDQEVLAIETLGEGYGLVFRTRTDENGEYKLDGLPPGLYFVCALAPYVPTGVRSSFFADTINLGRDLDEVQLVDLKPGEVRELDLATRR